jgi:RNA polymerase sigma factor (sigma-70 family)
VKSLTTHTACSKERALAKMNPRRRRIFMLHRFEQFTYAEIGGEVGMSEKGVKKQMAKALMELRRAAERPE